MTHPSKLDLDKKLLLQPIVNYHLNVSALFKVHFTLFPPTHFAELSFGMLPNLALFIRALILTHIQTSFHC